MNKRYRAQRSGCGAHAGPETAWLAAFGAGLFAAWAVGCGGRSSLYADLERAAGGSAASGGNGGTGGSCVPSTEVCNGLDDDCDGLTDEGDPGGSEACDTGMPGNCAAGLTACVGDALECVPIGGVPEQCNGVDDDCDGLTDEGDPGGGVPCDTGMTGDCAAGLTACVAGSIECAPVAAVPEVCNGLDDDCSGITDDPPACTRRVFLTSQAFTGDLGGLIGADQKCQMLADAAGLGGVFKAWLSDPNVSAAERLTHVGKPYVLVDGVTVVAEDWADLTDGTIDHAIDMTENDAFPSGEGCYYPYSALVWTATYEDGSPDFAGFDPWENSCHAWTSAGPAPLIAGVGCEAGNHYYGWSSMTGSWCDHPHPLYCFEQ